MEIFFRKISRFSAPQHNRKPIIFVPIIVMMPASCSTISNTMPTPSRQKTTPAKISLIIIRYFRFIIIFSFLGLKSQFYFSNTYIYYNIFTKILQIYIFFNFNYVVEVVVPLLPLVLLEEFEYIGLMYFLLTAPT